jgi:hypothetical protein
MSLSPRQSGLAHGNPYGYNPAYRMHYPIEGTIVAVHLPVEQANRSKREVEYDVQPTLVNMGRILNVPLALGVHGIVDAEEVLLRPMSLVIPSGQFDANTANPSTTDGDRVLVQFINGSFLTPVITHVLTHNFQGVSGSGQAPQFHNKTEVLIKENVAPGYPFGDGSVGSTAAVMTPAPGKRLRHSKLNGTHLAVDTLGNVFVNFKEHPDANAGLPAGAVKKKLVVQNEGIDLFRIEKTTSGSIQIFLAESVANVLVQVGDGEKSVPIGEAIQDLWDKAGSGLKQYVDVLENAFISWTPVAQDGGAALKALLNARTLVTVQSFPSTALSTKVKIPNG